MRLSDFKALSFDCYGTLIDWETGMIEALKPLTSKASAALARNDVLEAHARYEAMQQRYTPAKSYREILATVYKRLADEWGVPVTWNDCVAYGRSVGEWPPFADSAGALQYLRQHFKLIILSNVDNASFALSNRRLQVAFDAIYAAEDIGSYKPDQRNFAYMLENLNRIGIEKHQVLHTAESMFHDHAPANICGLKSAWIYRRHADTGFGATLKPETMPRVDFRFNSMADMVKAHQQELGTA
jgi:2-haloalkanoic acid dehalogenase type II